jgi:hypothetical protein
VPRWEFLAAAAGLPELLTLPPQFALLATGRRIDASMPGLLCSLADTRLTRLSRQPAPSRPRPASPEPDRSRSS